MRVHLVGMPHLDPVREAEWCAYSQKIRRLCDMLSGQGYEVIFYGGWMNDGNADTVPIVCGIDRDSWFGPVDWRTEVFNCWSPDDVCWRQMNARAIEAISDRLEPHDIIGLTMGRCQQMIASVFGSHVVAEVGIGYEGPLTSTHWCVESEAWRHYLYGKYGVTDGRFFDSVIPNAYDPGDLEYRADNDGYLLFLGRHTPRKGLEIVAELAKRHRVVAAGQLDGQPIPGTEYVGVVTGDDKRKLLAGARAVLVPTIYIEPFGGVAVEAMMSGKPVITSSFGAFTETVVHGLTGYRCHTLAEFLEAADKVDELDPQTIEAYAAGRFSTRAVAPQYDAWLRRLATLYSAGWYQ